MELMNAKDAAKKVLKIRAEREEAYRKKEEEAIERIIRGMDIGHIQTQIDMAIANGKTAFTIYFPRKFDLESVDARNEVGFYRKAINQILTDAGYLCDRIPLKEVYTGGEGRMYKLSVGVRLPIEQEEDQ